MWEWNVQTGICDPFVLGVSSVKAITFTGGFQPCYIPFAGGSMGREVSEGGVKEGEGEEGEGEGEAPRVTSMQTGSLQLLIAPKPLTERI